MMSSKYLHIIKTNYGQPKQTPIKNDISNPHGMIHICKKNVGGINLQIYVMSHD